jgi:hypothetical protein
MKNDLYPPFHPLVSILYGFCAVLALATCGVILETFFSFLLDL